MTYPSSDNPQVQYLIDGLRQLQNKWADTHDKTVDIIIAEKTCSLDVDALLASFANFAEPPHAAERT